MFGKKTYKLSERIERSLYKIVSTHTMLLTLFVIMYSYIFQTQRPLDELIKAGMIEDPLSTKDPLVQFFIAYRSKILLSFIGVPVLALLLVMLYNRLPD